MVSVNSVIGLSLLETYSKIRWSRAGTQQQVDKKIERKLLHVFILFKVVGMLPLPLRSVLNETVPEQESKPS